MEKDYMEPSSPQPTKETKIIHAKIIGGVDADVYDVGKALNKFSNEANLPYKLEFIVSNDRIELRDVNTLIKELYQLKKVIDTGREENAVPDM